MRKNMEKKNFLIVTIFILTMIVCAYYVVQDLVDRGIFGKLINMISSGHGNESLALQSPDAILTPAFLSINDLIAENKAMACAVRAPENMGIKSEQSSYGNIYVSGERVKMETEMRFGDQQTTYYILVKDGYQYSWPMDNDPNKGVAININAIAKTVPTAQGFAINNKMELICRPWTANESFFGLPPSIAFEDITEQTIENLRNNNAGQLPDDQSAPVSLTNK
jgi:hypothetical protein